MLRWAGNLLDRMCAVVGAVVFVQFPLFITQYTQQLAGREAELRLQVNAMRQSASVSGKTLEQLIQKFLINTDPDFVRQGELMQSMVSRLQSIYEALTTLQDSSILARPFNFLLHLNVDAFKSTLQQYTIGFPLNLEGGAYALAGIVVGYALFSGVRRIFARLKSLFSRVRSECATSVIK